MTKIKSVTQNNKIYSDSSGKNAISFLKTIKNKIKEIKSNNDTNKKYSLLSVIIFCFIEKGKSDQKLIAAMLNAGFSYKMIKEFCQNEQTP